MKVARIPESLDSAYSLGKYQRSLRFLQLRASRSRALGSLKKIQRVSPVTPFQGCLRTEEEGIVFVDAAVPADGLRACRRSGPCHDARQSDGQASDQKNSENQKVSLMESFGTQAICRAL